MNIKAKLFGKRTFLYMIFIDTNLNLYYLCKYE